MTKLLITVEENAEKTGALVSCKIKKTKKHQSTRKELATALAISEAIKMTLGEEIDSVVEDYLKEKKAKYDAKTAKSNDAI